MEWIALGLVYFSVGVGVLVWHIRSSTVIDSDQKKVSLKVLILIPEVCLFWPIFLFLELKTRRTVRRANNARTE